MIEIICINNVISSIGSCRSLKEVTLQNIYRIQTLFGKGSTVIGISVYVGALVQNSSIIKKKKCIHTCIVNVRVRGIV